MLSLVTWRVNDWPRSGALRLASFLFAVVLLPVTSAVSAVDYDAILYDRLIDVRELLDRRQAHRTMLTERVERFASRLDQLQAEREIALQALSDQEDRARAYERELDRLMPRLLPRLDLLDRFRREGARAIAGLASLERNAEIEDRTRSRLLASQATTIEQMRRASTAVRLLRRVPNTMTAQHRDIDFQIPLLAASANRLDLQQSRLQRRRDAAVRELADLAVDIERLTAEEHRLARNMLARKLEAKDNAGGGSEKLTSSNRRGLGKATIPGADLRGIALRKTQPTPVARPLGGLRANSGPTTIAPAQPEAAALSAKDETPALVAGRTGRDTSLSGSVAALDRATRGIGLTARVGTGRLDRKQASAPKIEAIDYRTAASKRSGERQQIQIAALPGQPVMAVDDGNVVFAGDFRSYGLLLIIEHGNGYHTLLWGFSSLDIEFGDTVRAGQIVGVLTDGPSPKLHVELRRNGQLVSPEVWLAASNSGVKG